MLLLLSTICPNCQLQSKIKESFILHLKNIYVNLPLNLVHLRDLSVAIQQAELPENSFTLRIIIQMHILYVLMFRAVTQGWGPRDFPQLLQG